MPSRQAPNTGTWSKYVKIKLLELASFIKFLDFQTFPKQVTDSHSAALVLAATQLCQLASSLALQHKIWSC